MKICKNCGSQNEDMSVYCSACGSLLDEKGSIPVDEKPVQKENPAAQTPPVHTAQQSTYQQSSGQQNSPQGAYQTYSQQGYYQNVPLNNPYANTQFPVPSTTKGKLVAVVIVAFLFSGAFIFKIAGIALGIIALIAFSDYENAARRGDIFIAQNKCDTIRKCSKAAWIVTIIGIVITILLIICGIIFGVMVASSPEFLEGLEEFGEEFGVEYFGDLADLSIRTLTSFLG